MLKLATSMMTSPWNQRFAVKSMILFCSRVLGVFYSEGELEFEVASVDSSKHNQTKRGLLEVGAKSLQKQTSLRSFCQRDYAA